MRQFPQESRSELLTSGVLSPKSLYHYLGRLDYLPSAGLEGGVATAHSANGPSGQSKLVLGVRGLETVGTGGRAPGDRGGKAVEGLSRALQVD